MNTSLSLASTTDVAPRLFHHGKRTISHSLSATGNIAQIADELTNVALIHTLIFKEQSLFEAENQSHEHQQLRLARAAA